MPWSNVQWNKELKKIALGYRAADPQRPARKPLEEIVKDFQ